MCEGGTETQTSGLAHAQVRRSTISPPLAQPTSQGGSKGQREHYSEYDRVDDDDDDIDDRDNSSGGSGRSRFRAFN